MFTSECPAGTYKQRPDPGDRRSCTPCPGDHQTSPPASSSPLQVHTYPQYSVHPVLETTKRPHLLAAPHSRYTHILSTVYTLSEKHQTAPPASSSTLQVRPPLHPHTLYSIHFFLETTRHPHLLAAPRSRYIPRTPVHPVHSVLETTIHPLHTV
jgi:hypothetical protein